MEVSRMVLKRNVWTHVPRRRLQIISLPCHCETSPQTGCGNPYPPPWLSLWESCRRSRLRGPVGRNPCLPTIVPAGALRRFMPTVVPADRQALSCLPAGALPRNRLASSATGGTSAISPLSRLRRQLPQRGSQGGRQTLRGLLQQPYVLSRLMGRRCSRERRSRPLKGIRG